MPTLQVMTFVFGNGEEILAKITPGSSVLAVAAKNKIPLDSSCLEGTCGSCRVILIDAPSELEPPGDVEADTRRERLFNENERLGCQLLACPGLKVKIPNSD